MKAVSVCAYKGIPKIHLRCYVSDSDKRFPTCYGVKLSRQEFFKFDSLADFNFFFFLNHTMLLFLVLFVLLIYLYTVCTKIASNVKECKKAKSNTSNPQR